MKPSKTNKLSLFFTCLIIGLSSEIFSTSNHQTTLSQKYNWIFGLSLNKEPRKISENLKLKQRNGIGLEFGVLKKFKNFFFYLTPSMQLGPYTKIEDSENDLDFTVYSIDCIYGYYIFKPTLSLKFSPLIGFSFIRSLASTNDQELFSLIEKEKNKSPYVLNNLESKTKNISAIFGFTFIFDDLITYTKKTIFIRHFGLEVKYYKPIYTNNKTSYFILQDSSYPFEYMKKNTVYVQKDPSFKISLKYFF